MPSDGSEVDDDLLLEERRVALLEAFAELTDRERQLLTLLIADPPLPYAEIGSRLDMKVGSIGPTRARILEKLRRYPSIAAFEVGHGLSTAWR